VIAPGGLGRAWGHLRHCDCSAAVQMDSVKSLPNEMRQLWYSRSAGRQFYSACSPRNGPMAAGHSPSLPSPQARLRSRPRQEVAGSDGPSWLGGGASRFGSRAPPGPVEAAEKRHSPARHNRRSGDSATRSAEDVSNTTACRWEHRRRHGPYVAGTNFDFDRPKRSGPTRSDGSSRHSRPTRTRVQQPPGRREES
jgi:hypothetical protein